MSHHAIFVSLDGPFHVFRWHKQILNHSLVICTELRLYPRTTLLVWARVRCYNHASENVHTITMVHIKQDLSSSLQKESLIEKSYFLFTFLKPMMFCDKFQFSEKDLNFSYSVKISHKNERLSALLNTLYILSLKLRYNCPSEHESLMRLEIYPIYVCYYVCYFAIISPWVEV